MQNLEYLTMANLNIAVLFNFFIDLDGLTTFYKFYYK